MKICPQCSKGFGDEFNFCPEDGTPLAKAVQQQDPLINKTLNSKYEIAEMIREDSLGRIFKAKQMPLGRTVILEVFQPGLTRDEKFHSLLSEAVRKYSKLQHVNIGTIYDMDVTEDQRYFITSEFVEGRPLATILKAEAPLEQERAINIFYQIADALHQAHESLIEHGYLTPQDIVVYANPDGKECVQIMNFGISKLLLNEKFRRFNTTSDSSYLSIDDIAYISAEQATGTTVDDLDDIYSFGVILYHALSGALPFQADTAEAMLEAISSLEPVRLRNLSQCRALQPLWDNLVDKCIQRNKAERFQSIKEVKQQLQRIGDALRHEAEPTIMRMKSDLQQEIGRPAPPEAVEEHLETTEVVPPPLLTGKKKSPPLAQTFMMDRKQLEQGGLDLAAQAEPEEVTLEPDEVVVTPPDEAPKPTQVVPTPLPDPETLRPTILPATPSSGVDIQLEEIGIGMEDTHPGAPEESAAAGFDLAPDTDEDYAARTVFIGAQTDAPAEEDAGKTLFIGAQTPAPPEEDDGRTVFIGDLAHTPARPIDEDTLAGARMAPPAAEPPADDPFGKTVMVDATPRPPQAPPAPPPAPVAAQPPAYTPAPTAAYTPPQPPVFQPPTPQPPPPQPPPQQPAAYSPAPTAAYTPPPPQPPPPKQPAPPGLPEELTRAEEIHLRDYTPASKIPAAQQYGAPMAEAELAPAAAKPSRTGLKIAVIGVVAILLLAIVVGGVLLALHFMKGRYGGFEVKSFPESAKVYLDGDLLGSTPWTQENIEVGTHTLKVVKEGYKPVEQEIVIEADRVLNLDVFRLEKIGAPTGPDQPTGPTDEQLAMLEDFKSKADVAFADKRYAEPPEDCALYYSQRILELDPENAFALEMKQKVADTLKDRAAKAAASKNWVLAEKLYTQLTEINPDDPEIRQAYDKATTEVKNLQKTRTESIKDLTARAEQAIGAGRLVTPPDDNAYEYCLQIKRLEKNNKKANTMIQRIKNQAPLQADEAILAENYDRAKSILDAYNRYFPGDRQIESRIDRVVQKMADAQTRRQQQERDNQQQQLQARARSLLTAGIGDYKAGNYQSAIDQLTQSVAIDPRQADAYFHIGASYLELKNIAKAQENFRKAIQLKPDYALAHLNMGILAQSDRNYDQAITHLRKVIDLGGVPGYPVDKLQSIIQEMEVRKSFAVLINRSIAVEHKHFMGGCNGFLVFSADNLKYETNEAKHAFNVPIRSLKNVQFAKGDEFSFQVGDQKYKFTIQNANAYADISRLLPEYLKVLGK